MIKKANIQWTAKTLRNKINQGNITFDLLVQRGFVWDLSKKSLLIHSMLIDMPIPPFYFVQSKSSFYDALDGKQRCSAIRGFIDGEYCLTEDTPPVIDENENSYEVAGMFIDDMPEWMQDKIKDYSLTIYYFENCITTEEIAEMFYRLNNGKPLTSAELTRCKTKDLEKFRNLAAHPLISDSFSEKAKAKNNDENMVMQAWVLSFTEHFDLSPKPFRMVMMDAVVTDEQCNIFVKAFDYIKALSDRLDLENSEDKRVAQKIKRKSHLVSCIYLAKNAIERNMSADAYERMVYEFFNSSKASVDPNYNVAISSGSTKPERVRMKLDALNKLLDEFIAKEGNAVFNTPVEDNQDISDAESVFD